MLAAAVAGNPLTTRSKLSLELEAVPLLDVLYMIAQQNGLNLVVSGDIAGDVSLRLDNVDISTALDAVLNANGYNYFLKGGVIVVKPATDVSSGELESRIMTLKYLDPITAQKALESRVSDKGKVVILNRTATGSSGESFYKANRILITDYPSVLSSLVELIVEMDVAERVIMIEAKIIEVKVDNDSKLGFLWPSAISSKLSGADDGTSSGTDDGTVTELTSSGTYDPNNGNWTWGKLSGSQLSLVLDMLQQDGNSRLVSDPRVSTVENHEAEIKIQTVVPIQTINRFTEGSSVSDIVTFQDEEIGIQLRVTPRINEGGTITLDVYPRVEDIIGFSGPSDNQKPITSERSIRTTITVEEGETAALGGLLKEDEIETKTRVPLLGHIPIIGDLLFTHHSKEKSTSDLIILITPTIIK
jgi:type IV pilus secretin PilQ/predicted competence protein